jgi:sulfate adenylyltransferase subunit 1
MVTGASTANLAIILIDARKGMLEQTNRHSFIASLLGIPHILVCINKMDLVDYKEEVFDKIVKEYTSFSSKLNVKDIRFIPISALAGDNVVNSSEKMDWYKGNTLLYELETIHISSDFNHVDCRFPIQSVIRPHREGFQDFRGYAGRIESGVFKPGDKVKVLPSGFSTRIKQICIAKDILEEAYPPMSVTITLEDEIDISRGDMIVRENNSALVAQDLEIMVNWMNINPLTVNQKLLLKHTTKEVKAIISEILYEIDINSLHRIEDKNELGLNSIGKVRVRTSSPLFIDKYSTNRTTGSLIFIDPKSNATVGAGMIV